MNVERRAFLCILAAACLGAAGCSTGRAPEPPSTPSHDEPSSGATTASSDPAPRMGSEGPWGALKSSLEQADFEAARLDAQDADWSVYAHHPNVYLRGLALLRLRRAMPAVSDEQIHRVVELLGDTTPVYTASCIELLTGSERGQGIDMHRALCQQNAKTVSVLADEVLELAPPEQVVAAIMTHLAAPGLVELTAPLGPGEPDRLVRRLRASAIQAPRTLIGWAGRLLPHGDLDARKRLLSALSVAPLGSGEPHVVSVVSASMQSNDALERMLAAAAVLRLTDRPGPEAVSARDEPRSTAVRLLSPASSARILTTIGPAASVLLDAILARLEPAKSDPVRLSSAAYDLGVIAAMGHRARRASATIFQLAAAITASKDPSRDYLLAEVIRTLGAISAPQAELEPFVLGHATSRELFAAATRALLAVGAKLGPAALARLEDSGREHCSIPRHPRAVDWSWDICARANGELEQLKRIANGLPPVSAGE